MDKGYALTPAESEALSLDDSWVKEAETFRLGKLMGEGITYDTRAYMETPEGLMVLVGDDFRLGDG